MNIKTILTTLLALLPLAAAGQNLNPTVEVSKSYEGKLTGVDKPQLKMAVPDSVYRFDLDFDYSVAETPYKGSYEFSPYAMEMIPAPSVRSRNLVYLKAGAGYQLHPELDFVWSPLFKKPFRMNVYATHRSFAGNYWNMGMRSGNNGFQVVDRVGKDYEGERTWSGYDFFTGAGVNGRYDWNSGLFRFDVRYEGIQQKDMDALKRSRSAVIVKAGVQSKYSEYGLGYKVDAGYLFGNDVLSLPAGGMYLRENDFDLDAAIGYGLNNGHRAVLDLGIEMASTDGGIFSNGLDVDVVPHYEMNWKNWRFDLGVRVSTAFKSASLSDPYDYSDVGLYPDIRVEYTTLKGRMKMYLDIAGDSRVESYSDVIGFDRRANMTYGRGEWQILDITDECVNIAAGAEGRLGKRFAYDLKAGYAHIGNALLHGLVLEGGMMLPALGYAGYDRLYVTADWDWEKEDFRFDGTVGYEYAFKMTGNQRIGLFLPPHLTGNIAFSYNWSRRIFAGVSCGFATASNGKVAADDAAEPAEALKVRIPGYADLGVNAEYVINRKLSVWLKGGNLLGMTIQRSPLYAEKGPYFTAGICLNL